MPLPSEHRNAVNQHVAFAVGFLGVDDSDVRIEGRTHRQRLSRERAVKELDTADYWGSPIPHIHG